MHRSSAVVRALLASAAIASAVGLAGCNTDGVSVSAKALKPLSADMVAEIERKNMPKESSILVRLFKEEAELEVWKQDISGRYALLKTYPICRWSGELGPKIKEGDRQAPEGFYTITPAQMNPNSSYYLAFNLGFPNAYDKANDRTGAFLMVHGDCSSRGCYAMTDEQISEIFALGRDSFLGGQKSFQVQAYPFRMTPLNMARHRNSPHMAFWRMIKQGYDHFEVTRLEPKVDVCEKRYVFDAASAGGAPPAFNPKGRCPAYQVPEEIATAVKDKRAEDERQFAEYARRGTPTAPVRTGADGGMHPTFLARLKPKNILEGLLGGPQVAGAQPGTLPPHVNPPRTAEAETTASVMMDNNDAQPAESARPVRVAASPAANGSGSPVSNLFSFNSDRTNVAKESAWQAMGASVSRMLGLRADSAAEAPAPVPKPKTAPRAIAASAASGPKPTQPQAAEAPSPQPVSMSGLISGAQPPLPASAFETRWSGLR